MLSNVKLGDKVSHASFHSFWPLNDVTTVMVPLWKSFAILVAIIPLCGPIIPLKGFYFAITGSPAVSHILEAGLLLNGPCPEIANLAGRDFSLDLNLNRLIFWRHVAWDTAGIHMATSIFLAAIVVGG